MCTIFAQSDAMAIIYFITQFTKFDLVASLLKARSRIHIYPIFRSNPVYLITRTATHGPFPSIAPSMAAATQHCGW